MVLKDYKSVYKCPYCGNEYNNEEDAEDCADNCNENDDVIYTENYVYTCEYCDKEYMRKIEAEKCEKSHSTMQKEAIKDAKEKLVLAKASMHKEQKKLLA